MLLLPAVRNLKRVQVVFNYYSANVESMVIS